jgi:3-phenylpropionate/trans-cinnamate dioxygenase ferredoxin reductase component
MKQYKYLIIGGGMAADAAVKGIREVDDKGAIGILTAEPDPPYKRPPLSKDLWTKDTDLAKIWCKTEVKGAEILSSMRVTTLDVAKREATNQRGEVYRYEKLLLATGGKPKRLPFGNDCVMYYRTAEHYRQLRMRADTGRQFAVLGGGFIGSEIAAALTVTGNKVTMVFPEHGIMGRMLPAAFAQEMTRYFENRGVEVLPGCKPSEISADAERPLVHLENGRNFAADGIVAGLGIEPNTQLAIDAALEVADGIVVDELLRTTHPDVFAAGDVANFHNPLLNRRLRVEHEDNALTMGQMAGRNMAGAGDRYEHLPFFYSDLFDVGYEAVGETDSAQDIVTELRDPNETAPIFYLKKGRVRGVVFWNVFGKTDAGRELIAAPGPHTVDGLKAWTKERIME